MATSIGMLLYPTLAATLLTLVGGKAASPIPGDREEVTVSYEVPSPRLSLGEPLVVEFRVTNSGSGEVIADLGTNFKGNFGVTVRTPSGRMTDRLRISPPRGLVVFGRLSIPPRGEESQMLVVNEWYDGFNEVGTYRIGLDLEGGFKAVGGAEVDASTTATIEVEFTPRDQERLRAAAERLASNVLTPKSVSAAFGAARALTYVADPIGVEYSRQVLSQTTLVDLILIDGLATLGGSEARQVLTSLARDQGERAVLARSALARLAASSSTR